MYNTQAPQQHEAQVEKVNAALETSGSDVDVLRHCDTFEDDCCFAKIKITNLCAKKVKAACIEGGQIDADKLCADLASIDDLRVRAACFGLLQANNICVDSIKVNDFEQCMLYKATVVYSADTIYNLGDPLNFNVVLDDPNGDVSTAFPATTYTVPKSGYYVVALQIDQKDLMTNLPVLGSPVAVPSIWVNGVKYRDHFASYMSFANEQHAHLTTLISLQAGDVVSAQYNILHINGSIVPVVGTVNLLSNGAEDSGTLLKIHYLSSDCSNTPLCQPCNPVLECSPCPSFYCH